MLFMHLKIESNLSRMYKANTDVSSFGKIVMNGHDKVLYHSERCVCVMRDAIYVRFIPNALDLINQTNKMSVI